MFTILSWSPYGELECVCVLQENHVPEAGICGRGSGRSHDHTSRSPLFHSVFNHHLGWREQDRKPPPATGYIIMLSVSVYECIHLYKTLIYYLYISSVKLKADAWGRSSLPPQLCPEFVSGAVGVVFDSDPCDQSCRLQQHFQEERENLLKHPAAVSHSENCTRPKKAHDDGTTVSVYQNMEALEQHALHVTRGFSGSLVSPLQLQLE